MYALIESYLQNRYQRLKILYYLIGAKLRKVFHKDGTNGGEEEHV
jgi:hypothetical protein